ncbi:MAG: hypothetical protein HY820_35160 [Acidobacteria bacterium]|nr:hypothetical protein [Acidobacteriota bacterium]
MRVVHEIVRAMAVSALCATAATAQIRVGEPKVYDERALRQMLASLESRLRELNAIDASKLNVDRIQGTRQSSFSLSLSGTTTPTPSLKDTSTALNTSSTKNTETGADSRTKVVAEKDSTTTVHSTGSTAEVTGSSSATVGREVTTPSVTAAPPPAILPSAQLPAGGPAFGLSASDVLDAQMNLSYQITNLRMLLDGAVSDRMRMTGGKPVNTMTTVLGFQISIDEQCKSCVAEVDIQVRSAAGVAGSERVFQVSAKQYGGQPQRETLKTDGSVRLVALMPREKTYNVATISEKAISIGAAAVVGVANIGGTGYWGRKEVYLVKDTDTVARDLSDKMDGVAKFGWQFRPVLGRKTVQGGLRQVFVVLSLPVTDTDDSTWNGKVTATARWRKFDAKNGVVGAPILKKASTEYSIEVFPTKTLDLHLGPHIEKTDLDEGAGGRFGVTIVGANFTQDTAAQAGDARITSTTGLIVDSNRMSFVIDSANLMASNLTIVGRYGSATTVLANPAAKPEDMTGLKIKNVDVAPMEKDLLSLTLHITNSKGDALPKLQGMRPLVLAGGRVFGTRGQPLVDLGEKGGERLYQLAVSAKELRQFPEVTVRLPLWPDEQPTPHVDTFVVRIPLDFTADAPVLLSVEPKVRRFAITGSGLVEGMKAELDTGAAAPLQIKSPQLGVFEAAPERVAAAKYLILTHPTNKSQAVLKLPPPVALPPQVTAQDPVYVGDIKAIKLTGTRLDKVFEVHFDGKALKIDPASDDKSLIIALTKEITEAAGQKEIHLYAATGDVVKYMLVVSPR